jgi:hypothetical protein
LYSLLGSLLGDGGKIVSDERVDENTSKSDAGADHGLFVCEDAFMSVVLFIPRYRHAYSVLCYILHEHFSMLQKICEIIREREKQRLNAISQHPKLKLRHAYRHGKTSLGHPCMVLIMLKCKQVGHTSVNKTHPVMKQYIREKEGFVHVKKAREFNPEDLPKY